MDALYYLTGTSMILSLLILIGLIVIFLIKPHLLNKHPRINSPISRTKITLVGLTSVVVALIGFGTVLGATEPASLKQARLEQEAAVAKAELVKREAELKAKKLEEEASKPVTKIETKTEVISFTSSEQNDGSIPLGERRVTTEGVNGERTITYEVTYVKNVETARKEVKNEVTKSPTTRITKVGTYVKPAPSVSNSGDGYVNSQGNYVRSPSTDPEGASAQCNDGTYSYSQNRRGTCSHHGGVARWL